MPDPEGNEFCAFVRVGDALPAYRVHGIGIDCVDAEAGARWWGGVFGIEPTHDEADDWWTITGAGPDDVLTLDFAPVPEPRTAPNRVHWDVRGRVEDCLAAGATHLWDVRELSVMADPEGNEFCVFAARVRVRSAQAGARGVAVAGEVAAVVEEDDAVAEPAPALLAVVGDDVGGAAAGRGLVRTGGAVVAHRRAPS